MPGAEGLDGGSPEIRPHADQALVSQGYDPEFEQRVDDIMKGSGMRLTRAEAAGRARDVDDYVSRVEAKLAELQEGRDGSIAETEDK